MTTARALYRYYEACAAKWVAEGGCGREPTDEALTAAFVNCVRPPNLAQYPMVRHAIAGFR